MENQPTPSPQDDIDARITAERHAADAYLHSSYQTASTNPGQSPKPQAPLFTIAQRKPILLVIIPLVFLAGIISVASSGGNDNKAHKTAIAVSDDSDSLNGSPAGDYVVGEDSDDTDPTNNTPPNTTPPNSNGTGTATPSNPTTNTPSKHTKPPRPPIKHQPPVIVVPPKQVIIGTPPTAPPPPKPPQPAPVKLGTLCRIKTASLTESSGLAASLRYSGVVYTHNDEGNTIFAVDIKTCKVKGTFRVAKTRTADHFPDPEAITLNHKTHELWFGDIGNGHPGQTSSMTSKTLALRNKSLRARIIIFPEPSRFSGTISSVRYADINYSDGMQNSEALLANPATGQGYIINKLSTSRVYKLPYPLKSGTAKYIGVKIPGYVTDATFTNSGKWVLVRYRTSSDAAPTKVLVYSGTTWKLTGSIKVPRVQQGESITVEKSGRTFLIGSEGSNSPLVRVALPSKYY